MRTLIEYISLSFISNLVKSFLLFHFSSHSSKGFKRNLYNVMVSNVVTNIATQVLTIIVHSLTFPTHSRFDISDDVFDARHRNTYESHTTRWLENG